MILTLFYVIAAAMMLLMFVVLMRSVFSPLTRDETNHRDVNIGIARDRKSVLKDALSKGHIDQDTYASEIADVETTLATELAEGPNTSQSSIMRGTGAVVIAGLLVGVCAYLYDRLGTTVSMTDAFLDQTGSVMLGNGATVNREIFADPNEAQPSLADLIPQLEERLAENPTDGDGWALLEFAKAEAALKKATELNDSDPRLIIMLAESGALQNDGDLTGDARPLIEKALAIDPNNQRGQLLLGLSHQQSGEHETALEIFQTLRANPNLTPQGVANLSQMMEQSKIALGGGGSDAASSVALSVTVTLSDAARAEVSDTDSVFIFARASSGPPMPLAVSRHTVAELPITVTLDDSQAMIAEMTLSKFPSVTVGARVSPSGNPVGESGDWYGEQADVTTVGTESAAGEVSVLIEQQQP